tara:strand:+ start:545 stop:646 length:102 start_codon:yes stop_codon:yes gene_type:complete
MSKELMYNPIKITLSPIFGEFFICGMMVRFDNE